MPAGGVIVITAKSQTISEGQESELPPGDYVRLIVRGEGEGMDAQTFANAMPAFFTTKGVGKGTGLSFSMVHGLMAQSGGKLVLRSTLGAGTSAELWLPVARDAAVEPLEAPPRRR